jgi:hypothetical protein
VSCLGTTSKITPLVFTTTVIKHDWTQALKATKIPCFRLTPVSNECLNFYRQFEKTFAASQSLGEWKCVTP